HTSAASRRRSSRSAERAPHRPVAASSARADATRRSLGASRRAPCRAGRCDALPSPPRSASTSSLLIGLPREEKRRLAQDLALLAQDAILTPQPTQLLPLLARQPLTLPAVDLRLQHPAPQRLRRDLQLVGDRSKRATTRPIQPHRLLPELRRELLPLRHADSLPGRRRVHSRGVNRSGSTPERARATRGSARQAQRKYGVKSCNHANWRLWRCKTRPPCSTRSRT